MTEKEHVRKIASCPVRNRCHRYLRHEPTESWVFCNIFNKVNDKEHPTPDHLIGTHYTGYYDRNPLCGFDGRSPLSKCDVYKKAVSMGFIVERSEGLKEIDKLFAELERSEKHLAAFKEVLKL